MVIFRYILVDEKDMNMKRIIIMIICLLVIGLGYGQVPTREEFLGVCDSLGITTEVGKPIQK